MSNQANKPSGMSSAPDDAASQREALKRSEKKAAEQQPGSFKDEETEQKKVEIGPDMSDAPIKGIDPDKGADSDGGSRNKQ